MIKDAKFVSVWDNEMFRFETGCRVDMNTGEVFDIEFVDVDGFDLEVLDYEGVIIDEEFYELGYNDFGVYSIINDCANMLETELCYVSLSEFEAFCGFHLEGKDNFVNRIDALYDVIPQMPDDVIMEYWHKYFD